MGKAIEAVDTSSTVMRKSSIVFHAYGPWDRPLNHACPCPNWVIDKDVHTLLRCVVNRSSISQTWLKGNFTENPVFGRM